MQQQPLSDQVPGTLAPSSGGGAPAVSWGGPGGGGPGGTPSQGLSQVARARQGFNFSDFIAFRYMITPPLITVIYIVAVVAITLGSLALLAFNFLVAIVSWVILMLWVRVVFEVMIVLFRINDGVQTTARRG